MTEREYKRELAITRARQMQATRSNLDITHTAKVLYKTMTTTELEKAIKA